ncbi:TPA: hypothetical protein ACPJ06_004003 [Vibrio diabolicus]
MTLSELKSWLQGQLTSTKASEQSWLDLAGALAQGIHDHVEGYLDRLKSRNSLYDMERKDLLKDTEELRKVFPISDEIEEADLPHVIMRRQDEVHFKKTIYPLVATLTREFSGMQVSWEPLYAPIDQEKYPYGDLFVTQHEIDNFEAQGLTKDDFFMTSRGVIRIPINDVRGGERGVSEEDILKFEEKVRRVIYPLVPLRIVCDGQSYFISIQLAEVADFIRPAISHIVDEAYLMPEKEGDGSNPGTFEVDTTLTTTDEVKASPIYGTPRCDAVPCDAIALDRRYY